ncbi:MAG: putative sulfate exporter family transporter [Chloroflexi bacterium]|nr:putative sulfate exporter family transporter [Chloroflexota bacterium]
MSDSDKVKRKPNLIEELIFGCTLRETPALIPGVALAVVLVVASIQLTNLINSALGQRGVISYIIVAILAGILIRNLIGLHPIFKPGLSFCLKKLLRLGIIMMGIRLSIFDVLKLGTWGLPIVILCILVGLIVTTYFTRLLKLPERLGTLIAVGTSICGASAIVATAPGIGAKDEEVSYAVANITVFGLIAMFIYPYLSHLIFSGSTTMVGLFTGTSIHETAQVAGAGLIYDQTFQTSANPTAADAAMVTKLVRNAMMAAVIPVMAYIYNRRSIKSGESKRGARINPLKLFPLFIIGFLVMAILRSAGDAGINSGGQAFALLTDETWKAVVVNIKQWSGYILATAMAGVGLGTSFATVRGLGIKPFYVGLFAATIVGVTSLILVLLIGPYVTL